jgi:hypothetical protein
MPTYEPKFALTPLQAVPPGTPVIYQQRAAFAGVNPAAGVVTLSVHDTEGGRFVYHYFEGIQPQVLMPETEIIVRPNMHTLADSVGIRLSSMSLFVADELSIVVNLPGSNELRLLGLDSGSLVLPKEANFGAFTSWEIGVMSLGAFFPILSI